MIAIKKLLAVHGWAIIEDLWRGSRGTDAIASTFMMESGWRAAADVAALADSS